MSDAIQVDKDVLSSADLSPSGALSVPRKCQQLKQTLRVHASRGYDLEHNRNGVAGNGMECKEIWLRKDLGSRGHSNSSMSLPSVSFCHDEMKGDWEPTLLDIFRLLEKHHTELIRRLDGETAMSHTRSRGSQQSMASCDTTIPVVAVTSTPTSPGAGVKRKKSMNGAPKLKLHDFRTVSDLESKHAAMAQEKSIMQALEQPSVTSANDEPVAKFDIQLLVGSVKFEAFFAVAILASSLLLGIQVEYAAGNMTEDVPLILEVVNNIFAFVFFMELVIRFAAKGVRALWYDQDWIWYWLDTIIVASSLVEVIFSVIRAVSSTDSDDGAAKNIVTFRIARIIRVTRLIRVLRVIRIVRFVRALRTLVSSILFTLRSLFWAMLLLSLVMYVFSILLTQAAVDYLLDNQDLPASLADPLLQYWGSLGDTMMTLFKSITGGLSWDGVATDLQTVSYVWLSVFLAYIVFAYFAVLNVMTGVFCNSAIESAARDQDMAIQMQMQNKAAYCEMVKKLFTQMDDDKIGSLTLKQLEANLNDRRVRALLDSMELEAEDAWTLFSLLDQDQSGVVEIEEFVEGCCRLRGDARSIDLHRLSKETGWMRTRSLQFMKFVESQLGAIREALAPDEKEEDFSDSGTDEQIIQSEKLM